MLIPPQRRRMASPGTPQPKLLVLSDKVGFVIVPDGLGAGRLLFLHGGHRVSSRCSLGTPRDSEILSNTYVLVCTRKQMKDSAWIRTHYRAENEVMELLSFLCLCCIRAIETIHLISSTGIFRQHYDTYTYSNVLWLKKCEYMI
jgi:hypothetical protein